MIPSPALISMAAEILGITPEEARKNCFEAPEIGGWYIWDSSRGGLSMLVTAGGERLVATSAVGYEQHVQEFLTGHRN